ncbi:fimbrial biogenesis chaperone [Vagococcus sp. WN89Y]|uniref:fimbrial biogenesis chaperone n=1 Tax=Vagococcus sp. WN89Y TaxID=3457258 RepID=UPI003FCDC12E
MQRVFLGIVFLFFISCAQAGVSISGTRVIFDGGKKDTSLIVYSDEKDTTPHLIQSFVDDAGELGGKPSGKKLPFIVIPPLFRLEPGKENAIRIVRVGGGLPEDRESVFWLNVKAIPGTNKDTAMKNILRVVLKNRIKLFYRPAKLVKSYEEEDFSGLSFTRSGSTLIVKNPTPFFITFGELRVGAIKVNTDFIMVPPKGEARYLLPAEATGTVAEWTYLNDYASASEKIKSEIK